MYRHTNTDTHMYRHTQTHTCMVPKSVFTSAIGPYMSVNTFAFY